MSKCSTVDQECIKCRGRGYAICDTGAEVECHACDGTGRVTKVIYQSCLYCTKMDLKFTMSHTQLKDDGMKKETPTQRAQRLADEMEEMVKDLTRVKSRALGYLYWSSKFLHKASNRALDMREKRRDSGKD